MRLGVDLSRSCPAFCTGTVDLKQVRTSSISSHCNFEQNANMSRNARNR